MAPMHSFKLLLLGSCSTLLLAPAAISEPFAGIAPQLVNSVAPEAEADPALEEAMRLLLFPVEVSDGQGHGPDLGSKEWSSAQRNLIRKECQASGSHRYAYNRVDLNGDGQAETVATVLGPMFCGTGGCRLAIFRQDGDMLVPFSSMTLFKPPLVVVEGSSKGWRDLITQVRYDASESQYRLLAFDGDSYPSNPSVAPAQVLANNVSGTAYLAMNSSPEASHLLPCEASRP